MSAHQPAAWRELADWLEDLASLLEKRSDARFSYNTSDDGVWLEYGPRRDDEVNLCFSNKDAIDQLRNRADWIRKRKLKRSE